MASILIFLLLSLFFTTEAQQGQSLIQLGSSLSPTTNYSSWLSPSGLYAFGFYQQDNGYAVGVFLAGIPQKTVVWTANRDNPPVSSNVTLNFNRDGRLILQSAQGQETDIANSVSSAASALMLDSGNFVLLNSANRRIWQSFEHPTDTLLPGQNLKAGQVLYSSVSDSDKSTGKFTLKMQLDGWLVLYPFGTPYTIEYGYWSAGRNGGAVDATLKLDDDGHLYTVDGNGTLINKVREGQNSTKGRFLLRIDADGILRLYSHNNDNGKWEVPFQEPTDQCAPMGICGLNAVCVHIDLEAGCKCLPGFAQVNGGNTNSDCERNFAAESCSSKDRSIKYRMEAVLNTIWENDTYSVQSLSTQQECEVACSDDCNCDAALFKEGVCTKQKLPLRFGRRQITNSIVALIKVGTKIAQEGSKNELPVEILIIGVSFVAFGNHFVRYFWNCNYSSTIIFMFFWDNFDIL